MDKTYIINICFSNYLFNLLCSFPSIVSLKINRNTNCQYTKHSLDITETKEPMWAYLQPMISLVVALDTTDAAFFLCTLSAYPSIAESNIFITCFFPP